MLSRSAPFTIVTYVRIIFCNLSQYSSHYLSWSSFRKIRCFLKRNIVFGICLIALYHNQFLWYGINYYFHIITFHTWIKSGMAKGAIFSRTSIFSSATTCSSIYCNKGISLMRIQIYLITLYIDILKTSNVVRFYLAPIFRSNKTVQAFSFNNMWSCYNCSFSNIFMFH